MSPFILGIKWQDHVSNEEVLKSASLPSIESVLLQVQLRLAGHVTRMEDVRMPKAVFFTELREGKRDRGAPMTLVVKGLMMMTIQSSTHQHRWHQPKRSGTLHLPG